MHKKVFPFLTYSTVELCALTLQICLLRDSTHTQLWNSGSDLLRPSNSSSWEPNQKFPFMYNIQGTDLHALLSAGYFLIKEMSRESTFQVHCQSQKTQPSTGYFLAFESKHILSAWLLPLRDLQRLLSETSLLYCSKLNSIKDTLSFNTNLRGFRFDEMTLNTQQTSGCYVCFMDFHFIPTKVA